MPGDDAFGFRRFRLRGVVTLFRSTTQHQCVGAREHVQQFIAAADGQVVDIEIGRQENQLTLDRCQFVVAK